MTRIFFMMLAVIGNIALGAFEPPETVTPELKRALISLTFDDGWESVYTNGVPLLKEYGYKGTFYINTGPMDTPERFSKDQIRELNDTGHEIAAHTVNHPDLNTLPLATVKKELTESKKTLEEIIKKPIIDFAAPYGSANAEVIKIVKNYFQSNRSTEEGFNSRCHFNPYEIHVQNMKPEVSLDQVKEWLDKAVKEKLWVVFVYHQDDKGKANYSTDPDEFKKHLEEIKSRNLPVVTIAEGLKEVLPQRGICK